MQYRENMKNEIRSKAFIEKPMKPAMGRSLFERFPHLVKEWDKVKNNILTPKDVSYGTTFKAYWLCSLGHSYQMAINNRTSLSGQQGCPYCSKGGNRVWDGNCLATIYPELTKEWHPTKNNQLTPNDVTYASPKRVWWKCKIGHEWQSTVYERSLSKRANKNHGGCPYCAGKRACKENCLATHAPKLSKEWHPTKNDTLTPNDVTLYSGKKVWWKCGNGHEWKTSICHRTICGTGCPSCSKIILKDGTEHDSLTEAYFYLKFKKQGKNIIQHGNYKGLGNFKFDFYFPEENTYVEVTGFGIRWAKIWTKYIQKIRKKKDYVEKKLGAIFLFKQKKLTPKDILYVRSHTI